MTIRRFAGVLLTFVLCLGGAQFATAQAPSSAGKWAGSWSASPQAPTPGFVPNWSEQGFANHTLRQVVRVSAGGSSVRIRLSNVFGSSPARITGATIGRPGEGAAVLPESIRPVTFHGFRSAVIPAGGELVGDRVWLPVRRLDSLSVTLYFAGSTGPATFHSDALATSYRAHGDHRADPAAGAFTEQSSSWYYLSGLDVQTPRRGAVATFGDSITDGYASTPDANNRYPDELAELLAGKRGVLNAGISGNRLLNDSTCFGQRGVDRFGRDVLAQPGVAAAVILEGINDIQASDIDPPFDCLSPPTQVSVKELICGYRDLIRRGHARGLRMIGATILPYRGSGSDTDRGEAVRDAVNKWIRTSGAFDAVADLDRAMAAPTNPDTIDPGYDSGDHIHPNDAGYHRMAEVIAPLVR